MHRLSLHQSWLKWALVGLFCALPPAQAASPRHPADSLSDRSDRMALSVEAREVASNGALRQALQEVNQRLNAFLDDSEGSVALLAEWATGQGERTRVAQADVVREAVSRLRHAGSVEVRMASHRDLHGAYAAFAARGPKDGQPVIYLNREWTRSQVGAGGLVAVLLEEYGHYLDHRINGGVDSPGDEGRLFAAALLHQKLDPAQKARIAREDDRLKVQLEGELTEIEMASLLFSKTAYFTTTTLATEDNALTLGAALPGVKFLFTSDPSSDPLFKGNNVIGTLYAVNASNEVVGSYYGEISRLIKTGSTVTAGQMFIYPKPPGTRPTDPATLGTTIIIDFDTGGAFASGQFQRTSSDPVDAALNALIPPNGPPLPTADSGTSAMPNCITGGALTGDTGTVLGNDSDTNKTFSINTAVTPNLLVETPDALSLTAIVNTSYTGSTYLIAPTVTLPGLYGSLTIDSDGTYTYTPSATHPALIALRADQSVTDVFTYRVVDDKGLAATANLTLTVQGGNDAPVAENDFKATTESAAAPQASGVLLSNDSDVDAGDVYAIFQASAGSTLSGSPTLVTDGTTTKTAAVRFTYGTIETGDAAISAGDTVTGTGVPSGTVIDTVVAAKTFTLKRPATGGGFEKVYLADTITQVYLRGSATPDTIASRADRSATMFYTTSTELTLGMTVSGDGSGSQGVVPGTAVNRVLAAGTGSYVSFSASPATGADNSTLATGETLTFSADATILTGQYGYLKIETDGTYQYFLTENITDGTTATDSFTYELSDGDCDDQAVLRIDIQGNEPSPPSAVADVASVTEAGGVDNLTTGSLAPVSGHVISGSDTHPSSFAFEVVSSWSATTPASPSTVTTGTNSTTGSTVTGQFGTLVIGADGSYKYTLSNSLAVVEALRQTTDKLTEVFYYEVRDTAGRNDVTTLTLTIEGANDAPKAVDDGTVAIESGGLANATTGLNPAGNVLSNDTDVDAGDGKTVTKVIAGNVAPTTAVTPGSTVDSGARSVLGTYGTLSIGADGTYRYVLDNSLAVVEALASGATLTEEFSYEVTDLGLLTDVGLLTVTIRGANDRFEVSEEFVNEGSPWMVFTVSGAPGQTPSLSVSAATTLPLAERATLSGADADVGSVLQVWDPASGPSGAWVAYNPSSLPAIRADGTLLVRLAVQPDTDYEGNESLFLTATTTDLHDNTGVGTINDEGQGSYWIVDNLVPATAVQLASAGIVLDDDRPVVVSNVTVNEASPYAVFELTGAVGQLVELTLGSTGVGAGHAILGTDTGTTLQYFNGTSWTAYTAGDYVALDNSGSLLVRVAIANDTPATYEGAETFKLVATTPGGVESTGGEGTIVDDGTGSYFAADNTTATSSVPTGVNLDDDRVMSVSTLTVNEGSPYAVFTVTGIEGQKALLSLQNNADGDDLADLEYFNGTAWVAYTPGAAVTLPNDGDLTAGETATLLVRVALSPEQEADVDGPEGFKLVASTISGVVSTGGDGTIVDDGTGSYFAADNTTATSSVPAGVSLDDDRVMSVSTLTVNEGSPYAVFTVTGIEGQKAVLSLQNNADTDDLVDLEYFNGTSWVAYTPGAAVTLPNDGDLTAGEAATLLVRVALSPEQEADVDGPEAFKLVASTISGVVSTGGDGTIVDDGTGSYFAADNTTATSSVPAGVNLDDDRVMSVSTLTVNEGSPYAVFTVTGIEGQKAVLSLQNNADTDDLVDLEYFNGTSWVAYTPGAAVTLPNDGDLTAGETATLLVRVALSPEQETDVDGPEAFKLVASTISGVVSTGGDGTIVDDGTGSYFAADNTTATSSVPAGVVLDDDRVMSVSTLTVNEGSPYAVFTVTGIEGQKAILSLQNNADTDDLVDLEYFNGTSWVAYTPGSAVTLPNDGDLTAGEAATLLVRVALSPEQESDVDGPEAFKLVASTISGAVSTGGDGTIVDDGTGSYFAADNTTATSSVPAGVNLDDDRVMSVSTLTVNEGSPYAVFTVTGIEGQKAVLSLQNNADTDDLVDLEYFNGTSWVAYTPGSAVTLPNDGDLTAGEAATLLVRVALSPEQETDVDGPEAFKLVASTISGVVSTGGEGTIVDDGTGSYFAADNNTATSSVPAGVNLDDDRVMTVSTLTVNEGSPYAVFTVTGIEGQKAVLSLQNNADTDDLVDLEYFNGTSWVAYTPGAAVTLPNDGDLTAGEAATLLVRVALSPEQEADVDGPEAFKLVASTISGVVSTGGEGTIVDDGTGSYFAADNNTATSAVPAGVVLDDDRVMSVSTLTVNEGSPYAVFTVTGIEGQKAILSLQNNADTDDLVDLEYFNGTSWVAYTPGSAVTLPNDGDLTAGEAATLLVRVALSPEQESDVDGPEAFKLVASTISGAVSTGGDGTIVDDGTGSYFAADNTTATSSVPAGVNLDDDRVMSVSTLTVNEGSPYAVFTVTGIEGQKAVLSLQNNADTDDLVDLEYFNGTAWVAYTPGAAVTLPNDGDLTAGEAATLLVRVALSPEQEADVDGPEAFKLVASTISGVVSTGGDGTIVDDGTGSYFAADNTTATSSVPAGVNLDDDRVMTVSTLTVNEGSPYAVFTVTGIEGQKAVLSLQNNADTDDLVDLEYFNGTSWVAYTPGAAVTLPNDGDLTAGEAATLLVRVALSPEQEADVDGPEAFKLVASTISGVVSTGGDGTIVDDGTGSYFAADNNTATSSVPAGVNLDDDRVMSVSTLTVNEGSPYAVFTVTGIEGQKAVLSLQNNADTDDLVDLEYFNGTSWVAYTPGAAVTLPNDGDLTAGETATLLVRVALSPEQEADVDGPEAFKLVASTISGVVSTGGDGTIVDDGTGSYFAADNTTATSSVPAGVNLDDDRVMSVSTLTVNEGSPYAVFTVTGIEGQKAILSLQNNADTDDLVDLEYFNGTSWVAYTPGSAVTLPNDGDLTAGETATLLVRVALSPEHEADVDGPEAFKLVATTISGVVSTGGDGTIVDDGTGVIFLADNTTATPDDPTAPDYAGPPLDDDRPMAVSDVTVNESSPYAVFTVTGIEGQKAILSLQNNADTDDLVDLEYFNGTSWVAYTPGSAVILPDDGDLTAGETATLLVRVALSPEQEADIDGPEAFKLVASTTSGTISTGGDGTILDNGKGDYFASDNTTGISALPPGEALDDDRPLTVTDVTVNEASPYAVFTVGGAEDQLVKLTLGVTGVGTGHAVLGTDLDTALEIFDGADWVAYVPGSFVAIPNDGDLTDDEPATLLVRVAISNDTPAVYEGAETFTLKAETTSGTSDTGTGTIVDDGTGSIFLADNKTATPDDPIAPGYAGPALDDDRPLAMTLYGSCRSVLTVNALRGLDPAAGWTVSLKTPPVQGTVTILPGGQARYVPNRDIQGRYEDVFILTLSNGSLSFDKEIRVRGWSVVAGRFQGHVWPATSTYPTADPNAIATGVAGWIDVSLTDKAGVSAKVVLESETFSIAGPLSGPLTFSKTVVSKTGPARTCTLTYDDAADVWNISLTQAGSPELVAQPVRVAKSAAALKGAYTVALAAAGPGGETQGYAVTTVSASASVKVAGEMAWGGKFTASGTLLSNGLLALYQPLGKKTSQRLVMGLLLNWDGTVASSELAGSAEWRYQDSRLGGGLSGVESLTLLGSKYDPALAKPKVLGQPGPLQFQFDDGFATATIPSTASDESPTQLGSLGAESYQLSLSRSTGMWSGRLTQVGGTVPIRGVTLQTRKQAVGIGFGNAQPHVIWVLEP